MVWITGQRVATSMLVRVDMRNDKVLADFGAEEIETLIKQYELLPE